MRRWLSRSFLRCQGARLFSLLPSSRAALRAPVLHPEDLVGGEMRRSECHFLGSSAVVWEIRQGRVLFDYGVVANRRRRLLAWLSPDTGGNMVNHPALQRFTLPPETRIDNRIGVASSHSHQVYYHWMFDILPRVGILQAMGLASSQIIVNTQIDYQKETLRHLGLDVDSLINPPLQFHGRVSHLLAPGFLAPLGTPSPLAMTFLRSRFLPPGTPVEKEFEKIFVGRAGAAHRRLLNEKELFGKLQNLGFCQVNPGEMSVARQIRVFASAKIVVGVHGAALANTVFCAPGTQVIELMPSAYEFECYRQVAEFVGLKFRRLRGESKSSQNSDFEINVDEVLRELPSAAN